MRRQVQLTQAEPGIASTRITNRIIEAIQGGDSGVGGGQRGWDAGRFDRCIVKVTSPVDSSIGRYNCRVLDPLGFDPSVSGNLTEAQLGTLPAADDGIAIFLPDVGQTAVGLASFPTYALAWLIDVDPTTGKAIVVLASGGGATTGTLIKITGSSAIVGAFNRWRYTWVEQRPLDAGQYEDVPAGMTHATAGYAYNTVEANNGETGVQGNSTNVDTLPSGYAIAPVQGNPVVEAKARLDCNGVAYWSFQYENAVTNVEGACA